MQPPRIAPTIADSVTWWQLHTSGSAAAADTSGEQNTSSRFGGSGSPRSNHRASAGAEAASPITTAPISRPSRITSLR